ncbi:hypothetical protein [Vibrio hippocampi]|uniref:Uncharacterized protein n=1 Tax=Vibrio hippocampi TaxID=654686 RepID=A0ABN8DP58_9VIBR|nr:hypothetical protein [Vibrio hippocampi]CAH0529841.1 hypothetical protein VHP8226_03597 [Vibrio hippocampi]
MELAIYISEKVALCIGVMAIVSSLVMYGRRSQDWKGIATMFYKRIPLTTNEYKYYRLGISLLLIAVILKIGFAVFWPAYSL